MDAHDLQSAPEPGKSAGQSTQGTPWKGLAEAVRFWEPRRVLYNILLAAFVVAWVVGTWPHFRPAMKLQGLLFLVIFALLANVCYCAAYLAEIPIQGLGASTTWSHRQRWAIWVLGTLLAILFENYWIADEIYPFVQ